ncbi:DUF1559 domain-containing protein [bacterium]|nr:DUF1559 domain-containing protein [bacterium]
MSSSPGNNMVAARRGTTVVELLVALSILSLLMALLSPAVMQAREQARRAECSNKLRQLVAAAHEHHAQFGKFPVDSNDVPVPLQPGLTSPVSMQARLLPFLERDDLFAQLSLADQFHYSTDGPPTSVQNSALLGVEVDSFVCPSDSAPAGGVSYRVCAGTSPGVHQTIGIPPPDAALSGMATGAGRRLSSVTDGTSSTVFFSERLTGDRNAESYNPRRDVVTNIHGSGPLPFKSAADGVVACNLTWGQVQTHASFSGSTWLVWSYQSTMYNHVLGPNSSTPDCANGDVGIDLGAFSARSNHGAGVNVALVDGSVRFVSETVDLTVWRALASVAGNESVSGF